MSCRRSNEIDLVGFLADPAAQEFAPFRAHYPGCADCAAAVVDWTALDLDLRGDGTHPSPEELLAWEHAEARAEEPHRSIGVHLSQCATCTEELVALRTSTAARRAHPTTGAREPESRPATSSSWIRPAASAALVILLAVPLYLYQRDDLSLDRPGETIVPAHRAGIPRPESMPAQDEERLADMTADAGFSEEASVTEERAVTPRAPRVLEAVSAPATKPAAAPAQPAAERAPVGGRRKAIGPSEGYADAGASAPLANPHGALADSAPMVAAAPVDRARRRQAASSTRPATRPAARFAAAARPLVTELETERSGADMILRFSVSEPAPWEVEVIGPRGAILLERRIETSDAGRAAELRLPSQGLVAGRHRLRVRATSSGRLGSVTFEALLD